MLVSRAEMTTLEEAIFASGPDAETLMEAVGQAMARTLWQEWREPRRPSVVAYVGRGHNGGDALVIARALHSAGARVTLRLAHATSELAPLTAKMLARVSNDVPRERISGTGSAPVPLETFDLLIDGLLGLNATGALRPSERAACREINALRLARAASRVVAVDLPSGLDADTGASDADAVRADLTLTVGFAKPGLIADDATNFVGRIAIIRLPEFEQTAARLKFDVAGRDGVADAFVLAPLLPPRDADSHKGLFGRVGIFAGSEGFTGAAVLASLGALRGGAGLVTLFVRRAIYPIVASSAPPEAMVTPIDRPTDLLAANLDVLALGPGLGRTEPDEVCELITRFGGPAVVDADALNLLAAHEDPDSLLDHAAGPRLLTPHPGEMERLFPCAGRTRAETARAFVKTHPRTTLLLKGTHTVVAQQDQPLSYNSTGTPGMATGGMGDVLTGVAAALLGQRLAPFDAARLGAWLCGRAAELAIAEGESESSLLPTDVIAHLGAAFRDLLRREAL
jgi:ADP-dependent NAD(P)H-hydrate dehydratase / NAD(P)H-hydrate epimerase